MMHRPSKHQAGLSLIEMMVALTVGLVIVSGAIAVFVNTVKSQKDTLGMSRLNQEMRSAVDLMSRDIRRAGYWAWAVDGANPQGSLTLSAASGSVTVTAAGGTPFTTFGASINGLKLMSSAGLATFSGYTSGTVTQATVTRTFSTTSLNQGGWLVANPFSDGTNNVTLPSSSCITYSYDRNSNGVVDTDEHFGFRLNSGNLEMHTAGAIDAAACGSTGTWTRVNSTGVTVTGLTFGMGQSSCINTTTSTTSTGATCTSATNGHILVQERRVDITLTGQLVGDTSVNRTFEESVKLRNDRVTVQ